MAKKTYVKLINTVLRELNIAEISDPTIATGQASLVANYFNDAQHSIYTEEDWYSSYKERVFQTSKDAYITIVANGSLSSSFTSLISPTFLSSGIIPSVLSCSVYKVPKSL